MYSRYGHRYLYVLLPIVALSIAMLVHVPLWAYHGSIFPEQDFIDSFLPSLHTWLKSFGFSELTAGEIKAIQMDSFTDIAYLVIGFLMTAGVFKRDLEGPGIYRIIREHTRLRWFVRKSGQLLLMAFLYAAAYTLCVGCLVLSKGNYAWTWSNLGTMFIFSLHNTFLMWLFAILINIIACYLGGAVGFIIGLLVFGALFLMHLQNVLSTTSLADPQIQFALRYNPVSYIADGFDVMRNHVFFLVRSFVYCLVCGVLGAIAIRHKDLSLRHSEA